MKKLIFCLGEFVNFQALAASFGINYDFKVLHGEYHVKAKDEDLTELGFFK